eukprot:TRINITY_DN10557_c0_g1_i2.p1 TRINITY_DN10557_c0_g1~~TRINITY_DN10557_c0_g1_i2.p1  ORF type:complete len:336 (-),score=53.93 TRINITY_DN10557_c0_g1_i2:59-1066(-)
MTISMLPLPNQPISNELDGRQPDKMNGSFFDQIMASSKAGNNDVGSNKDSHLLKSLVKDGNGENHSNFDGISNNNERNHLLGNSPTNPHGRNEERKKNEINTYNKTMSMKLSFVISGDKEYEAVYLICNKNETTRAAFFIKQPDGTNETLIIDLLYPNREPIKIKDRRQTSYHMVRPYGYLFIVVEQSIYFFPPPNPTKKFLVSVRDYILEDQTRLPIVYSIDSILLAAGGITRDNEPAQTLYVYNWCCDDKKYMKVINMKYGRERPIPFADGENFYLLGGCSIGDHPSTKFSEYIKVSALDRADDTAEMKEVRMKYINFMITKNSILNLSLIHI